MKYSQLTAYWVWISFLQVQKACLWPSGHSLPMPGLDDYEPVFLHFSSLTKVCLKLNRKTCCLLKGDHYLFYSSHWKARLVPCTFRQEQTRTCFSLLMTPWRCILQLSFTLRINTALQRWWQNTLRYLVSHKFSLWSKGALLVCALGGWRLLSGPHVSCGSETNARKAALGGAVN